jgi:membrane protein implicated in regulation of membrane protease activity
MTALGLALIVLAVALFVAEAHLSSGGLIGSAAGSAAVGAAALLLLSAGAGAALVLVVSLFMAGAAASLLVLTRQRILRPITTRPRTGREALVGHVGVVRSTAGPETQIFIDGSLWRAVLTPVHEEPALHDGDRVVVERVNGLTLCVRKAEEWELNP